MPVTDENVRSDLYEPADFNVKYQVIASIVEPGAKVLDVGCASGFLAEYLVRNMNCHVIGIELDPISAERARSRCQRVVVGDVTDPAIIEQISGHYDYVIFADVIEHLPDPEGVLIRAREWIGENGLVIISLPNIAYYRIRLHLLRGKFEYRDIGIMDRTHLRFYTKASAKQFIESCGLRVLRTEPIFVKPKDAALGPLFPTLFAYIFVFVCEKNTGETPAEMNNLP